LSATHDRPIRGRFHAWFLSATEKWLDEIHGERKRRLFGELPQTVVEIGPGTGANCRYYRAGTKLVAVEPNLRMHGRLAAAAASRGIDLDLRGLGGEGLDLPDAAFDAVVCTLVLCSVDDPARVLREAHRVLRPGGRFVFIEHVAAPRGSALRAFQNAVQPPWTFWFEGCRPNRETETALGAAGFSCVDVERFRVASAFVHVSPHIAGVAVK
jgi:SAM-dependent methyltransferase